MYKIGALIMIIANAMFMCRIGTLHMWLVLSILSIALGNTFVKTVGGIMLFLSLAIWYNAMMHDMMPVFCQLYFAQWA